MPEFDMNYAFFIIGVLLIFAIFASKLSSFFGTPLLLLFLAIGMLTGEDGIILHIHYTDYSSAFLIANLMLAVILLDGGLRTSFSTMKTVATESTILATLGVVLTSGITGFLAYLILDISLIQALLLGCIVGSTDAAAVFSLLGKDDTVSLKSNVSNSLQIESATNDPMAILLTTTMIAFASAKTTSMYDAFVFFCSQFGFGILVGIVIGYIARVLIANITLGVGLYCIFVIGIGLIGFAITTYIGGSGFLAIFIIGMCIGNQKTRQVSYILPVSEGFTWLSQITLFLLLGLLVSPHEMVSYWYPGVVIAVVITLIARPLTVFLCIKPFFRAYNNRDLLFMSWVGLRGSVPIVLAIYPVFDKLDHPQLYFNVAFVVVIVSLLFQGSLIVPLSKILKVYAPSIAAPINKSDVGIMLSNDYELMNYRIKEPSFENIQLRSIVFPKGTNIAAVFREGKKIKCQGDTRIRIGDILSIIGTDADEPLLNALFSHQVRIKSHSLYHGDKIYNADTPLIDLAEQFDFELTSFEKTLSLADMMSYQIGGFPEPGDEVNLIKVSLVVVELEGDKIKRVGLYLAQERTAEYERLRRAKFNVYKSEQDNMQRRREEATKQLFDSIDDDEEYNT
ncbi:MAG: potassium/proton antiporter [Succinivibrio sp.]|uniref:potassium/proton antiporter n=1 Tax=Succinivibrio sp. TaxID=2053619 RepID=UPI002F923DD2